jgi:beta-glucosidase
MHHAGRPQIGPNLFGERPFTGQLPMTWPRTEEQVPINVGDADYEPLFPYGWGLRTEVPR